MFVIQDGDDQHQQNKIQVNCNKREEYEDTGLAVPRAGAEGQLLAQ